MFNDLEANAYNTKNGTFYCSEEVDKKMVSHFVNYGGHSLDEIENLKMFLSSDSVVFDVGAHIGTFTIPLSRVAKKIYSFEPNQINVALLEKNIDVNGRKNIEVIKKPVTNEVREVGFVAAPVSGQSHVDDTIRKGSGLYSVTLDSINVTPNLIKLDIEGFELKALQGAEKILKTKPVLYIEYALWCLKRAGNSTKELDSFLREHGYVTYLHIKDNDFVKLTNLSQIISKDQTSNLLCISESDDLPHGLNKITYIQYLLSKIKFLQRAKGLFTKP